MFLLNRRELFEQALFSSAAAIVCNRDSAHSEEAYPQANQSIRHAIIGSRIRGKAHGEEFARIPGVEVAYVCDPDEMVSAQLADQIESKRGRRPKTVRDMRYIFDDQSVDTVSIATPNHWHALAAIWAMQAGKDVYVEKPVSHNIVEGRRMVQVARKTGRVCQVGTQNRSSGPLAEAAEFIQTGKLGELKLARTVVYGHRGSIGGPGKCEIPPTLDFNLWLGPGSGIKPSRSKLHYDWHWVWDTGNGELGNNNIHMVDICRWLMGLTGLGEAVFSIGGRFGYGDAGETPNTQIVVHGFGPVTIIQEVRGLKSAPFDKPAKSGYVIYGEKGIFANETLFTPDGEVIKRFDRPGGNHFSNFIDVVRSRRLQDLKADILEGHQSTGLCHVGNISYRLGRPISAERIGELRSFEAFGEPVRETLVGMLQHLNDNEIDLNKHPLTAGAVLKIDSSQEKFVNSKEADDLLGRAYRAPFNLPAESAI
jgi:predicted dehydrogenase